VTCAVCLEDVTKGCVTECGHEFCLTCVREWMRVCCPRVKGKRKVGGVYCPVCRAGIQGIVVQGRRVTVEECLVKPDAPSPPPPPVASAAVRGSENCDATLPFSSSVVASANRLARPRSMSYGSVRQVNGANEYGTSAESFEEKAWRIFKVAEGGGGLKEKVSHAHTPMACTSGSELRRQCEQRRHFERVARLGAPHTHTPGSELRRQCEQRRHFERVARLGAPHTHTSGSELRRQCEQRRHFERVARLGAPHTHKHTPLALNFEGSVNKGGT